MEETTRAEHLAWCKQRALAYLSDDPASDDPMTAFSSMVSDLNKHKETRGHVAIELGTMLFMTNNMGDMREFIEGFN